MRKSADAAYFVHDLHFLQSGFLGIFPLN